MSALYAWLRRHPTLVDCVLAFLLIPLSIGQVIHGQAVVVNGQPTTHLVTVPTGLWIRLLEALLLIVPVAVRRRIPDTAFALAALSGLIQLANPTPMASDIALLVLLYTVAAYRPRQHSVIALLACLVGSVLASWVWMPLSGGPAPSYTDRLIFATLVLWGCVLAAWVLGDSMRYRRGYYAALEDRAARLEAERSAQAKIAAAAERARIARELHDVVAHHVSVMVVQADGAGYAMRSDPDRAQAALSAISSTGRQALTEMRRLLGVLRSADQHTELAPVPGLGELRELLDQARTAGLEVSYTLTGKPRELPEGAELAAYRVVQESLTNTRKHAGLAATAAVTLRYEPEGLTVEVTDDGMAPVSDQPGGHGLAGMRERIAMYGGTVQAGPLPGGGFGVTAHLPCPSWSAQLRGRTADGLAPVEPAAELKPEPLATPESHPDGSAVRAAWSAAPGLSGGAP
ncbi:MAG TPA: histidine kinase [Streptosporangiaceae bacterium]|nr:histidine kinase [Streptosporangiaceae bacterium]